MTLQTLAKSSDSTSPNSIDYPECPKCGKHTIVHPSGDAYRCLNCDFQKDFGTAESEESPNLIGFLLTGGFGMLVLLSIL